MPRLVYWFYRLWSWSWRLRRHEPQAFSQRLAAGEPFLIAMWHGDELGLFAFCRFYPVATMTSYSKDGELLDYVLRRLGFATTRGSSSRGGAGALRGLVRLARAGYCPVITVDGPKGPVYRAKPGILELARLTGLPIFPCAMACSSHIPLHRSWDLAALPLPFARVLICWGDPIEVDSRDAARSPHTTRQLEAAINACRSQAKAMIAPPESL